LNASPARVAAMNPIAELKQTFSSAAIGEALWKNLFTFHWQVFEPRLIKEDE
jgi:hypothetical protein